MDILLDRLEEAYGTKPVLYATGRAYDLYLKDAYEEHPIWIRNILTKPELPDGRNWTFWQYADRARLDGYRGEERFIDLQDAISAAAEGATITLLRNATQEKAVTIPEDAEITLSLIHI